MKFRAVISDEACMNEFFNIIGTLSKTFREIAFIIHSDRLLVIGNEYSFTGVPQAWADIHRDAYFTEYQMVGAGVGDDDDEYSAIVFSIVSATLTNALIALINSPKILKMKLTNQDFPCLTVNIEVNLENSATTREFSHYVPVTMIPIREWDEYKVPKLSKFSSTISMPTLRSFRILLDKIKNLSPSLSIYCKNTGQLSIVVETDSATVASHYQNLDIVKDSNIDDDCSGTDEVSCRVDSKQLATWLANNQFLSEKMFCSIKQDQVIKVLTEIRNQVFLNCVLWAVNL